MKIGVRRAFRRSQWAIVLLASAGGMFAQQALDNQSILKLVRTGLSEDILLAIVTNEPGKYAVAANDLTKLKKAGVPDAVVAAMIEKQYGISGRPRVSPGVSPQSLSPLAAGAVDVTAPSHPSWMNSPVPQWSKEEARQVLTDSPWVKKVQLDVVRTLSLFERREGGDWDSGIPSGFGLSATGFFGDWREAQTLEHAYARSTLGTVMVRWESALPVRAAESKTGETSVPGWVGDYYAIAVHHIRRPFQMEHPANQLKGIAHLRRDMKKDLKPFRVVVLPEPDGLATFVYLFPRSTQIATTGGSVGFVAQIGRLFVATNFVPEDMRLQGAPQL